MFLTEEISPLFIIPMSSDYLTNTFNSIVFYQILGAASFLILLYFTQKGAKKIIEVLPGTKHNKSKLPFILSWFGLIPCYLLTITLLKLTIDNSAYTTLIYILASLTFITGLFYSLGITIRMIIFRSKVSKQTGLSPKEKILCYRFSIISILYAILPVCLFSFIPTCLMLLVS